MATLIDVGTPTPALAFCPTSGMTNGQAFDVGNITMFSNAGVTMTTANTPYNLDSKSLTVGTWCLTAFIVYQASSPGTTTAFFSGTTASATNLGATPITAGGNGGILSSSALPFIATGIVKVTGTTTVYLNAENTTAGLAAQGMLIATQIK